jgi:hypothetical protein
MYEQLISDRIALTSEPFHSYREGATLPSEYPPIKRSGTLAYMRDLK